MSQRYFNVAVKELPDGLELQIWEPYQGEVGVTTCAALGEAEATARAFVVELLEESPRPVSPEEMSIHVYELPRVS